MPEKLSVTVKGILNSYFLHTVLVGQNTAVAVSRFFHINLHNFHPAGWLLLPKRKRVQNTVQFPYATLTGLTG